MRPDVYFSVDIEADGPIPGPYSMISVGLAVAGRFDREFTPVDPTALTFYRELRPISDSYVSEALAVSGLDRDALLRDGTDPATAMNELSEWVHAEAAGAKPVVVAYPACFDWMFLYWYLIRFTGASVFGHSGCLDIKTAYAVKAGARIGSVGKGAMPRELRSSRPHTHNALDDAIEQAELFVNVMAWAGPERS
jgi:hypothetical protein